MGRNQKNQKVNLKESMYKLVHNPLGFVNFAYDWNKGILKGEDGPDAWQEEELEKIGEGSKQPKAFLAAIKSGHEVGKTTLAAWIIHWFISTRPHPQIVATANTKAQLETKLWRELAKWWKMSVHREWFEWTATKFYHRAFPETWFAAAIPWSKDRSEAFQGTHEKHVLMVYDESSIIDDAIWEATEGSMPEGGIWLVTGNPTRVIGRFRECWFKFRHRWSTTTVDARNVKHSNKARIKDWIDDYGDDSDFVRVRVTGEFPRASVMQFIPIDLVEAAIRKKLREEVYIHAPIVIGVDVARFGDDETVILVRQGGHIHSMQTFREIDTMQVVGLVTQADLKYKPQSIFVDEVGVGAAVVDRLRNLGYKKVIGVNNARKATDVKTYHNIRAESWAAMRTWLETGSLPDDEILKYDLIAPEFFFDSQNRIQLERKEDMKRRGLPSPNRGDALAMTFVLPVYTASDIEIQREMIRMQQPSGFVPLNPDGGY